MTPTACLFCLGEAVLLLLIIRVTAYKSPQCTKDSLALIRVAYVIVC